MPCLVERECGAREARYAAMRGRAATRSWSAHEPRMLRARAAPSRSERRSAAPRSPGTARGRRSSRARRPSQPPAGADCARARARSSRGTSAGAPRRKRAARALRLAASGPRSRGSPAIGWCVSCTSSTKSAIVSWSWCEPQRARPRRFGASPRRGPRKSRMLAVCATITRGRPCRKGGAKAGRAPPRSPEQAQHRPHAAAARLGSARRRRSRRRPPRARAARTRRGPGSPASSRARSARG